MQLPFHNIDRPSTLFTHDALHAYLDTPVRAPEPVTATTYAGFTDTERADYDRARLVHINGSITITTPTVKRATQLLTQCFTANLGRNSGQTGLMLNGPATAGKTETAKALMRFVYTHYRSQFPHFQSDGRIPVVYVSVPADCTGKTLMRSFASFLGLPVTALETMGATRSRVIAALQRAQTQLVVVDELQNLNGRGTRIGESIDLLKNLHNELPATFVYAGFGLDSDNGILNGDRGAQLRGRFTVLEMGRLNPSNTDDKKTWLALVNAFEKSLTLRHQKPGNLKKEADYLFKRTSGSVGSLAKLLTLSASELISNPKYTEETITVELMDRIVLDHAAEQNYKNMLARGKKTINSRVAAATGIAA